MFIQSNGDTGRKKTSLHINLESAPLRWAFSVVFVLAGAAFCWEAARVCVAAEYAASVSPKLWCQAAQLEPDNAAYWANLVSMQEWDFERGDLREAAADYAKAVEANPSSDHDWLELARVYERLGETSRAQAAYEGARDSYPISPEVAWRYGNFLLRTGDAFAACSQFRKALLVDPELTEGVVEDCLDTGSSTSIAITEVLPSQKQYYFKALDYFCRRNKFDAALRVWEQLLALGQPFDLPQALSLINDAIAADRVRDAQRVWQQAIEISRWPRDAEEDSSLIFNGSFEDDLVNGGFDWRKQESPGVGFAFDADVVHSGMRSLRVSFDGNSNIDFQHLLQCVPVEPAVHYRFTAYLKIAALSTDSGVRFLITDPFHAAMSQVFTEGIVGTRPWTRTQVEFVTGLSGCDAGVVREWIVRAPRLRSGPVDSPKWEMPVPLTRS